MLYNAVFHEGESSKKGKKMLFITELCTSKEMPEDG